MEHPDRDKCFVIMPFGAKTLKDGSGSKYDFDKVYRVIIKRAILQAGMQPFRADEQTGARIIHSDMFKELRDRAVVLADLSSENPNVYYELGIRHVLAPQGTVLMCREGSELPFDIKLSRVIFYRYDGQDLDWDNVEQVIPKLQAALEDARRGTPDSPVHALLEKVFPAERPVEPTAASSDEQDSLACLSLYQKLVAVHLAQGTAPAVDLLREHGGTVFGARVLGYLCLDSQPLPEYAAKTANRLYDFEQYALACEIFDRLNGESRLGFDDLIRYGSALSEKTRSLAAAEDGLALTQRAFDLVSARAQDSAATAEEMRQVFKASQSLSGMLLWRWLLTRADQDLTQAIERLQATEAYVPAWMKKDEGYAIGRVAQLHLRLLFLLRHRDAAPDRPDTEKHRDAVLRLQPTRKHPPREVSYLRWYKAIALADAGDETGVSRAVTEALRADDRLADPACADIGKRQYTLLRRFIEHHLDALHHHALLGQISRALQMRHNG